jgi:uncharacterized protein (DUF983 family)
MPADAENLRWSLRAWGCLKAILGARCPRCWTGKMFRSTLEMNDPCPICGLIFEREQGYFLGAMYFSYLISLTFLIAFYLLASLLLPGWNSAIVALIAVVPYLPFVPFVFRYSRVLWTYYDRAICPTELSAGSYEKNRLKQTSDAKSPDSSCYND